MELAKYTKGKLGEGEGGGVEWEGGWSGRGQGVGGDEESRWEAGMH